MRAEEHSMASESIKLNCFAKRFLRSVSMFNIFFPFFSRLISLENEDTTLDVVIEHYANAIFLH